MIMTNIMAMKIIWVSIKSRSVDIYNCKHIAKNH